MASVQLVGLPEDDESLWLIVQLLFGVKIPRTQVCPDHVAPFTAFADAYFGRNSLRGGERSSMGIWHASRGLAGKSKTLSILGLILAYLKGADITILGGSMAQSTNVHEYMRTAMDRDELAGMEIEQTSTKIALHNKGRVRPLTASQRTVRGPHPSILLCMAGWTRVETPDGYVRIDSLSVGRTVRVSNDIVSDSWGIVRAVADQGYRPTVTLELSDGTEITCTPDHRFATDRGWVEARHLTSEDVLRVRRGSVRSASQRDGSLRRLPPQGEVHATEDLFGLSSPDPREGKQAYGALSRMLAAGTVPPARRGNAEVRPVRGWSHRVVRDDLWTLLRGQPRARGGALPGLREAAQGGSHGAVSTLPSAAHVIGSRRREVRCGQGDRQVGRADLEIGDLRGGAARPAGQALPAGRPVRPLGAGLRPARRADGDRSSRGVLARSPGQRGPRPGEAGEAGGGRLSGAVLAHGSDAPVVVGLRPGPLVRTWDITTDAGNFFAEDILVHNCDEVDEMDLAIYDAALGQPMPQPNYLGEIVRTYTVVSSTWQNPSGTFTEILRRAEERGTQVYAWCYLESSNPVDGWLTEDTIQEKRDSVSAEMFRVEYDLGEPAIGNRAFDKDAVEAAFSLKFKPDDPIGAGEGYLTHKVSKDFEEYTFAKPVKHGTYVAGADWAKEKDYTIIWCARVDEAQRELVYYMRVNRRPYPQMIGFYNKVLQRYNVPHTGAWHDSTGLGNVVNDYLDARAHPFTMTGDKRAKLLSDYVNAIEKGSWKIPRIKSAYLEHKYCRTGDLYKPSQDIAAVGARTGADRYHLPDTVCAAALAEYAAKKAAGSAPPVVVKRDPTPTKLAAMFTAEPEREHGSTSPDAPQLAISFLA